MSIFKKEISWKVMDYDVKTEKVKEVVRKKTVEFKEFDVYDPKQAKFHFYINSIPSYLLEAVEDYVIDPEFVYELTKKYLDYMAIIDESSEFKESDKKELMANSQSLYFFGKEVLKEKITPFFLQFRNV
jgi:hypothetical protein